MLWAAIFINSGHTAFEFSWFVTSFFSIHITYLESKNLTKSVLEHCGDLLWASEILGGALPSIRKIPTPLPISGDLFNK